MRFFQHFLTQCYPHHPLKQEEIWTHEIPCIAHNVSYVTHALVETGILTFFPFR